MKKYFIFFICLCMAFSSCTKKKSAEISAVLEKKLSVTDYLSKLEGKYTLSGNDEDKDFFEIKNAGDGKISVTTDIGIFAGEEGRICEVAEIENKKGILLEITAEAGFTSHLYRATYKAENDSIEFYWKYDKATVDDDLNVIDETHGEKIDVYIKVK